MQFIIPYISFKKNIIRRILLCSETNGQWQVTNTFIGCFVRMLDVDNAFINRNPFNGNQKRFVVQYGFKQD